MTTPPTPVDRVLVVADDLTGANDTGVQFAQAGWSSTLRLGRGGPVPTGAGVAVAQSSDARALADAEAARRTRLALAVATPSDGVYLKVDSTLRGSVLGQLSGALSARREQHPDAFVLLCPAYPRMGRTVEDGVLLVHGRPVTESPAGVDPVTPVLDDRVGDLVPGSIPVPIDPDLSRLVSALTEAGAVADVVAVDARTDDDLDLVAAAVLELGPRVLVAGSAGLARPLAERWLDRPPASAGMPAWEVRRPLVVVSSHHEVARRQVEAAAAGTVPVTVLEPTADALLGDVPLASVGSADTVVLLSPSRRADPSLAPRLAQALARRAVELLGGPVPSYDALVLIGGDGAEAVLAALDAHGIRIHGQLLEGVPLGQVAGGAADGMPVVTKAGGFGEDHTLVDLLTRLHTTTGTETPR